MRLIFMGTPGAAVPSLRRCVEDGHDVVAVWTQPDRPSGRGNKLTASPVKQFALRHNLPVYQFAKIKTEEALEVFASHGADASVVVAYGRILPLSFLQTPLNGCINVHFSLLPKYRGAAPVNWAIVRGETRTGVTTMRIDEGLDTGAILLQRETEIGREETAPQLMNRLAELGAGALSDTLNRIDGIEPRAQNDEEATHAPVLRREDGLINWSSSAGELERRVRGFQPWPNAYTLIENRRLVIWRASVLERIDGGDSVGEIVEANGDSLVVRCGEGTGLRLLEVQPETKRMMSARDFLNGARLKKGVRLG
ncbi:MAG: methionyl-tRNA formyltransferase [Pyrinomonadaceae bacterium]|jgi:methionyl-tRNA formyltransferase|nr:methionyl-tRNA formyltransferase [Pyrinomonadaceae bacterium]